MSVTIRLTRTGKRNAPTYRVVAATTRDKLNGKPLEVLGFYNPTLKTPELKLNTQKIDLWKTKGAIISPAVAKLLAGKYVYTKYNAKALKEQKAQAQKEDEAK